MSSRRLEAVEALLRRWEKKRLALHQSALELSKAGAFDTAKEKGKEAASMAGFIKELRRALEE